MIGWLCAALLTAGPASQAVDKRPTVAILYFDYDGEDASLRVLKKGFAQVLITDLSAIDSIRLVERARLQEVLDEQKLGLTAKMDKATVARLGKLLGARYVIAGAYFDLLGALRVDSRTIDVETGQIIRGVGATGSPGEFMEMEQKLALGLTKVLLTQIDKKALDRALPVIANRVARGLPKTAKIKSVIGLAKGLDAKDRKDAAEAKKELTQVVAEEPDFGLAQNALKDLMQ